MPLHLLGKKSWNVYNADNIARVRRDEEAAQAREEAEEQRLQEIDAERRIASLRGEVPPPLPAPTPASEEQDRRHDPASSWGRERKKRKRAGEDDTDFELRVARERTSGTAGLPSRAVVPAQSSSSSSNAPLTDKAGHIDLFPVSSSSSTSHPPHQKNPEAEAEKARKKREYEDQYTMRFSNAAGFKTSLAGPWYATNSSSASTNDPSKKAELGEQETTGKDVWGNSDPQRKDRDAARIQENDPLAMMKRGAAKVREVEKGRKSLNEERHKEVRRMRKEDRVREKKRRRNDEQLDGCRADGAARREGHIRRRDTSGDHDEDDGGRRKHRSSRGDDERHGHRHEPEHRPRHGEGDSGSRRSHSSRDRP
ncbi:hypothetical protein BJ170DRAFT_603672 [Xylariales sp. AK1849]|nr:hypothetical protein BJ170DRAFT_603672 [Xylariales sp. AK1849]